MAEKLGPAFAVSRVGTATKYGGTIYGCMVATEKGYAFQSRRDALENARQMREQCREIVKGRRD